MTYEIRDSTRLIYLNNHYIQVCLMIPGILTYIYIYIYTYYLILLNIVYITADYLVEMLKYYINYSNIVFDLILQK